MLCRLLLAFCLALLQFHSFDAVPVAVADTDGLNELATSVENELSVPDDYAEVVLSELLETVDLDEVESILRKLKRRPNKKRPKPPKSVKKNSTKKHGNKNSSGSVKSTAKKTAKVIVILSYFCYLVCKWNNKI